MRDLNEQDKTTLEIAKLRLRIGKIILFFVVIMLVQYFSPTDFFSWQKMFVSNSVEAEVLQDEFVYQPIFFDSTDVKSGFHVPSGMIADTGLAEVVQNCGACHSLDLVKQNKATKEGWKEKIVWMQQTQKLWDLGVQEDAILNYLAKNYGPKNFGRRKNLENIEWYKL